MPFSCKISSFLPLFLWCVAFIAKGQQNIHFLVSTQNSPSRPADLTFVKNSTVVLEKSKTYWLKFSIHNDTEVDQSYVVYTTTKWGWAQLQDSLSYQKFQSGSLRALSQRTYPNTLTVFKVNVEKRQRTTLYLALKGEFSIYTPKILSLKIKPFNQFDQEEKQRYWWQGIFIGIIVIMALYNFLIYIAVRDISYLYYVMSILGIGVYFFFYYGFGIELSWQNSPYWDTYAFGFIVPLTNLARIYFTKSYLHLGQYFPLLNKALNLFSVFCLFIGLLTWICYSYRVDWLDLLVDLIGFLGTSVLSMMLLCGILVARQGYRPAIFFSIANLILVLGGNLFIIRELGWISDNTLTRYGVQYGVLAQVVLFSLGLSSRLNQAQVKVAQLELEKERERKQLLEEQSQILQQKVYEQTADLTALNHLKDKLLSIISHDLRNPLVSLDSFMNLLVNHQNRLSEQEQITLAQKAKQSLANLNQLLSNLLLWSQSQMKQVSFRPQWLEIAPIIASNIQLHSLDIELKNIKIEVNTDAAPQLFADAEMIDFVVRNLLGNAIKFSHKNGVVEINTKIEKNCIILTVIDFGVGMTSAQLEQLATKKLLSSTRGTAKEKGSGLGLVLCREFLEMHGGSLKVSSKAEGILVKSYWPIP